MYPRIDLLLSVLIAALLCCSPGLADDEPLPVVTIADPYIELHSGPGRGYPILHVSEKGRGGDDSQTPHRLV